MSEWAGLRGPRALAIEALVVVTSILAAFALDAWWDERGAEAREQTSLVGVLEDLRSNQEQREARIELEQDIFDECRLPSPGPRVRLT